MFLLPYIEHNVKWKKKKKDKTPPFTENNSVIGLNWNKIKAVGITVGTVLQLRWYNFKGLLL